MIVLSTKQDSAQNLTDMHQRHEAFTKNYQIYAHHFQIDEISKSGQSKLKSLHAALYMDMLELLIPLQFIQCTLGQYI